MSESVPTMLQRIFLGPMTSFRNGHRTWLYLGFILLIILLIAISGSGFS